MARLVDQDNEIHMRALGARMWISRQHGDTPIDPDVDLDDHLRAIWYGVPQAATKE